MTNKAEKRRRGLEYGYLCNKCNVGMGQLRDSVETLANAINYLENPPADGVRPEIIQKSAVKPCSPWPEFTYVG